MNAAYTGENRRAQDRRVLPAAEVSGAHFQRKAAEERADMLADQMAKVAAERDELLALVARYVRLDVANDSLNGGDLCGSALHRSAQATLAKTGAAS